MRKVVIITGASRGLGREIARTFGQAGWGIAVNYLNSKHDAESVAEDVTASGGDAVVIRADVGDPAQADRLINSAMTHFRRLDVLVNNAGVSRQGLFVRLDENMLDETLRTNLKGPFNTIRAASEVMARQGFGHIINVSSIVGVKGRAGHSAYAASKAALVGLTKASAIELAPHGIQVNCVLPGYMLTEMGTAAAEKTKENALADNLLKKYSIPAEVASFIYNLTYMSSASGQVFNLDSRMI